MSESWEDLPDVEPAVTTPKVKTDSWESLPYVESTEPPKLSNPYAGQEIEFKKQEQERLVKSTGTFSQGSPDDLIKAPDSKVMDVSHLEATKDTPIIPGMTGTSPTGIRSAMAGVTMNAAPRILASLDAEHNAFQAAKANLGFEDKPFTESLNNWHRIYAEAREDAPGMNLLGGVVSPMPFAKAKLMGKVFTGAAMGFISEWLGTDPEAATSTKLANAGVGAAFGGAIIGGMH